jgi:hypothetical protein
MLNRVRRLRRSPLLRRLDSPPHVPLPRSPSNLKLPPHRLLLNRVCLPRRLFSLQSPRRSLLLSRHQQAQRLRRLQTLWVECSARPPKMQMT